jgi:hypothetical protein
MQKADPIMTTQPDPLQRESFRCTADEKSWATDVATMRGMTFSQFVRLAIKAELKRGKK